MSDDLDLAELIDRLDTDQLHLLEQEFGIFTTAPRPRIRAWADFWLWAVQRALSFDTPQPESLPVSDMRRDEREAITTDLLAVAEQHCYDDGLVKFCSGLVAQIGFTQLDVEAQKQDLQAHIDAYRRQHPHGSVRGDTRGIPPWSEISGPTDDPPV